MGAGARAHVRCRYPRDGEEPARRAGQGGGAIAADGANIDGISMDEDRSAYTNMHFTLQVADRQHLARVKRGLRRIPEVVRIARVRD